MRLLFGVVALTLVAGCGWFRSDEEDMPDYLQSKQMPRLEVPEDLRALKDSDPFPIPPIPEQANASYYPDKPPLPDAIYAKGNRDEVRMQRLGERMWLVVPEPPTTAWPKVKQFLADNGVAVALERPAVGRLNTQWMQVDGSGYRDVVRLTLQDAKNENLLLTGQDRFLLRVEQGLRRGSTEIHLRHENDSVTLPVRDDVLRFDGMASHIVDAEQNMLNEIGAYIAAKVSEQVISRVAQQIGSARKAELTRNADGIPVLNFFLDFERAWATLGQSLSNAEVEVRQLDRQRGEFQVAISDALFGEEERRGFLCRVTFSCGSNANLHELTLRLVTIDDGYQVRVFDPEGDTPDTDLTQQVLVLLREFAS